MTFMRKAYCGCVAVLAALTWAAPASADDVLVLGSDGNVRAVQDRWLPEPVAMPAPPAQGRATATTARRKKKRTVAGELRR
ncbi:MAG: hypothetical protein ACRDPC_24315, partial [Solirubrobacteraceae bacterium]